MNTATPIPVPTVEDPFHLGWRYLRETDTDGQETFRKVPLTERDLLFPQEEDRPMIRDPHTRDMVYLREALRSLLQNREPPLRVFAEHRIDFDLEGVEPLGPDLALIEGIDDWPGTRGTLLLAEQGRTQMVVEITSPDTRNNDLGPKRSFYRRAGVPIYVIVDHRYHGDFHEAHLLVLRLQGRTYRQIPANDEGLVWLQAFGLSIAIEDNQVWLFDSEGNRFEETPEIFAQLQAVTQQLAESEQTLQEEQAARQEAERRIQELEERIRQMEAQYRQRNGHSE